MLPMLKVLSRHLPPYSQAIICRYNAASATPNFPDQQVELQTRHVGGGSAVSAETDQAM
jgi:hypothetical protein